MNKKQKSQLEKLRDETIKSFGVRSAQLGSESYALNVVPTPSLMLDYKLGRGGLPYGALTEVYGGNAMGKTTVIGYGVLANVQREGKLAALLAVEPYFDADWAQKLHGLDPELLLVQNPKNVQEAFDMLRWLVFDTDIDFIMVDSIGAMGNESSQKEGGKSKAYGVSGEVTSGLNDIMPVLFKTNKGLLIINQQRQAGQGQMGTWYESPGGEALKHHALVRIQLKPGSNRFKAKVEGKDIEVGRELKAVFKKNKMAQAANKAAEFNFYNIWTPEYGLGIDKVDDTLKTAKVAGVIQGTNAWPEHSIFPKGKVQGMPGARKFFEENPDAFGAIREEVLDVMLQEELEAAEANQTKLQVVS